MNRIDARFAALKKSGKKAFIAYITAGDPSMAQTEELVYALERSGADIIELGIPFSDPIADGPTIQAASQRALAAGATMKRALALVRRVRRKSDIPLVFMTYYNPVFARGVSRCVNECASAGVDGIIVPDLPVEEASDLIAASRRAKLATVFLVAPTSPPHRIRMIARASRGFVYYVSLTGVTGVRSALPSDIASRLSKTRRMIGKPLAVGFGVSTPSQARMLAGVTDGVIVGSALVKIIDSGVSPRAAVKAVSTLARGIAKAVHGA